MQPSKFDGRDLVILHQGLVRSIAITLKETMARSSELEDLISYGQVGLAEAAADFDPERGTQFSTYAYYRIRGAILDGACQMGWYKRAHLRRLKFQQHARELLERQSEEYSDPQQELAVSVSRLVVVGLALDAAADGSVDAGSLQDPGATDGENTVLQQEASQMLRAAMSELPDLERELIRVTYFEGQCLADFARAAGKSRSWASRLHDQAIDRLAKSLRFAGMAD